MIGGVPGRSRFVVTIVLASVLGLLLLLFGLLLLAGAIADRHSLGTGGMWADIVLGAVSLGLAALCGRWIMHLEHRARGHQPGKIAIGHSQLPPAVPTSWRKPRRRRFSPVANVIFVIVWAAVSIGFIVSTVSLHSQADRSSYVQAHGIMRVGAVGGVDNVQHQGRYSTWYTAQVTATLPTPVAGRTRTTAYIPHAVSTLHGFPILVLVDPAQPGYAELPGQPYVTSGQWIGSAVVAAFFALFDGLLIWVAIKTIRRRHAWRAIAPDLSQTIAS